MKKLVLKNVSRQFINNSRSTTALKDVNIQAKSSDFISIIGPTGCGKTTLLRLVAGLLPLSSGEISMDGRPVEGLNRNCTLVFQQFSLFPWFNVIGNVAFALEMKGVEKVKRRRMSMELLRLVGLEEVAKAKPYELSGGMQQRVAIARALAYDPEILLMDEPFGSLDERTRNRLQNILLNIWQEKRKTVLFVTHSIDEAIYMADRIVVMASEPGRVIDEIPITLPRPRNRLSEEFTAQHIRLRNLLEVPEM